MHGKPFLKGLLQLRSAVHPSRAARTQELSVKNIL
jgi:hypothetical protein